MAVKEYKFTGVSPDGQPVQGSVFAGTKKAAQKKVDDLAERHAFRSRTLEPREVYLYRVRHANGKIMNGEQKAFSAEEIE